MSVPPYAVPWGAGERLFFMSIPQSSVFVDFFPKAKPHNSGAQIAQSELPSDWPKTAGNTLCIVEDFWAIWRNIMQARCVP
jgi:hypothetical protein